MTAVELATRGVVSRPGAPSSTTPQSRAEMTRQHSTRGERPACRPADAGTSVPARRACTEDRCVPARRAGGEIVGQGHPEVTFPRGAGKWLGGPCKGGPRTGTWPSVGLCKDACRPTPRARGASWSWGGRGHCFRRRLALVVPDGENGALGRPFERSRTCLRQPGRSPHGRSPSTGTPHRAGRGRGTFARPQRSWWLHRAPFRRGGRFRVSAPGDGSGAVGAANPRHRVPPGAETAPTWAQSGAVGRTSFGATNTAAGRSGHQET